MGKMFLHNHRGMGLKPGERHSVVDEADRVEALRRIASLEQQLAAREMDTLNMVQEWHEAFGVPNKTQPDVTDERINKLRVGLIREELSELEQALNTSDEVEALDALCDLQYVLDGTFLSLGFSAVKDRAFREVHRSNMSELGPDGRPIYRDDGKVLKGPHFKQPDLAAILDNASESRKS